MAAPRADAERREVGPGAGAARHPHARRVVARTSIAPLLSEPRVSSSQVSQLLRGHPAEVLDEEGSGRWLRVRGADGYDGWCHTGYLRDDGPAAAPLRGAWATERRMSLGCTVAARDAVPVALPLGALLEPDEQVLSGLAMNHRARARYFAQDAAGLIRRAVELFSGAPYQWGGVTPWGVDCSGMVQTLFALHGTGLPRDAWQQAELGRAVESGSGGDLSELAAADVLFFSDRDDGRITHVALSLGESRIAHSSLSNGGFAVDDLMSAGPITAELRRTFRGARRIW